MKQRHICDELCVIMDKECKNFNLQSQEQTRKANYSHLVSSSFVHCIWYTHVFEMLCFKHKRNRFKYAIMIRINWATSLGIFLQQSLCNSTLQHKQKGYYMSVIFSQVNKFRKGKYTTQTQILIVSYIVPHTPITLDLISIFRYYKLLSRSTVTSQHII